MGNGRNWFHFLCCHHTSPTAAGCSKRPALSPARPEFAKTASSPKDAPFPKQGRSSAANPHFTLHASRFTVPGSDARMMPGERRVLARQGWAGEKKDFFNSLLAPPSALLYNPSPCLSHPTICDRACKNAQHRSSDPAPCRCVFSLVVCSWALAVPS